MAKKVSKSQKVAEAAKRAKGVRAARSRRLASKALPKQAQPKTALRKGMTREDLLAQQVTKDRNAAAANAKAEEPSYDPLQDPILTDLLDVLRRAHSA